MILVLVAVVMMVGLASMVVVMYVLSFKTPRSIEVNFAKNSVGFVKVD